MRYRLVVASDGPAREAAERLEADVFAEWFGNTRAELMREYGPYRDASLFVTVLDDVSGAAAGCSRLIVPSPAGLKILRDLEQPPWRARADQVLGEAGLDLATCWEVATLAVARDVRRSRASGEIALALYHGVYASSVACGAASWLALLDDNVLTLVQQLGLPWRRLPGQASRPYLGSPSSTPVAAIVSEAPDSVRAQRPDLHQRLVFGMGFEDVEVSLPSPALLPSTLPLPGPLRDLQVASRAEAGAS